MSTETEERFYKVYNGDTEIKHFLNNLQSRSKPCRSFDPKLNFEILFLKNFLFGNSLLASFDAHKTLDLASFT